MRCYNVVGETTTWFCPLELGGPQQALDMTGRHFSVKTLLLASAVVALTLGTIVTQWSWLSALHDLLVWGALAAALTAAVVADPPLRMFSRGFAVWSGLYFLMAYSAIGDNLPGPHVYVEMLAGKLHEEGAPVYLRRLAGTEPITEAGIGMYRIGSSRIWRLWGDEWKVSRRAVHGLATLALGCLGGGLAAYVSRPVVARIQA